MGSSACYEPPRDCRRPNSLRGWVMARGMRYSPEVRERSAVILPGVLQTFTSGLPDCPPDSGVDWQQVLC